MDYRRRVRAKPPSSFTSSSLEERRVFNGVYTRERSIKWWWDNDQKHHLHRTQRPHASVTSIPNRVRKTKKTRDTFSPIFSHFLSSNIFISSEQIKNQSPTQNRHANKTSRVMIKAQTCIRQATKKVCIFVPFFFFPLLLLFSFVYVLHFTAISAKMVCYHQKIQALQMQTVPINQKPPNIKTKLKQKRRKGKKKKKCLSLLSLSFSV